MSDRRRAQRYVLETPLGGQALQMQDALVEEMSGNRLVVISPSERQRHDELTVHLPMSGGVTTHSAHVVSSTPVTLGGAVSFRLELKLT